MPKVKVIEVVTVKKLYQCSACRTKYTSKGDASWCAKMPVEKKMFSKGDTVRYRHKWQCNKCGKWTPAIGKVIKVLGPQPYDAEREAKIVQDPSPRMVHRYFYNVDCPCLNCGDAGIRKVSGVALEFTLVGRGKYKAED